MANESGSERSVIGIYHKDCIDGTAAAAAVLRKYPAARLYPLPHSYTEEDLQPVLESAGAETGVYTVDCTLGAREFLNRGLFVTTIDHHAGAREECEALARENDRYTFIFDNDKSGASLSWAHFFPGEKAPPLIAFIEDADLWKWQFGDETKFVSNYLSMFRNDPDAMLGLILGDIEPIREKGKVLSAYADKEIEFQTGMEPLSVIIGGIDVPAYNITTHQSASGNILSERTGKAVAMFTIKGDMVKFGFRSKEGQHPNSLELAGALGGGGHPHAAGASVTLDTFISMIRQ